MLVSAASADDGTAAPQLLACVTANELPRLTVIYGDNKYNKKYNNKSLDAWMKTGRPDWSIEVQSPPPGPQGFSPVRIRWVVERTHAWHGRSRRNSQDYERKTESAASPPKIPP